MSTDSTTRFAVFIKYFTAFHPTKTLHEVVAHSTLSCLQAYGAKLQPGVSPTAYIFSRCCFTTELQYMEALRRIACFKFAFPAAEVGFTEMELVRSGKDNYWVREILYFVQSVKTKQSTLNPQGFRVHNFSPLNLNDEFFGANPPKHNVTSQKLLSKNGKMIIHRKWASESLPPTLIGVIFRLPTPSIIRPYRTITRS